MPLPSASLLSFPLAVALTLACSSSGTSRDGSALDGPLGADALADHVPDSPSDTGPGDAAPVDASGADLANAGDGMAPVDGLAPDAAAPDRSADTTVDAAKDLTSDTHPTDPEALCLATGGTVVQASCCQAAGDFPDGCVVGACSCSPSNSHQVKKCSCATGCYKPGNGCGLFP